jgi:hypothetical protein
MNAQGFRAAQVGNYAGVHRGQLVIAAGILGLKNVIIRVVAMYKIPYVHPLASQNSRSSHGASFPKTPAADGTTNNAGEFLKEDQE